jgi:hypothetical protein
MSEKLASDRNSESVDTNRIFSPSIFRSPRHFAFRIRSVPKKEKRDSVFCRSERRRFFHTFVPEKKFHATALQTALGKTQYETPKRKPRDEQHEARRREDVNAIFTLHKNAR